MSTHTQILYHIVFSTKNRERNLVKQNRKQLFNYIWGILQHKNCHLYQINGVENHIHIITHLHPSIALAALIKDIKLASHRFIREQNVFPDFIGWQEGYGAFTYSYQAKESLIAYVKNQEEHHRKVTFEEELVQLLEEHSVRYDPKYLFS